MSVVLELLRAEEDGTISFGNQELQIKSKKSDFEHRGGLYKVKTCQEITRLEKNDVFVFESVPGTTVLHLDETEKGMSFCLEGGEDAQITLGLAESENYSVRIDGKEAGELKTNISGKLSFGVELDPGRTVAVEVKKIGD